MALSSSFESEDAEYTRHTLPLQTVCSSVEFSCAAINFVQSFSLENVATMRKCFGESSCSAAIVNSLSRAGICFVSCRDALGEAIFSTTGTTEAYCVSATPERDSEGGRMEVAVSKHTISIAAYRTSCREMRML